MKAKIRYPIYHHSFIETNANGRAKMSKTSLKKGNRELIKEKFKAKAGDQIVKDKTKDERPLSLD